MTDLPDNIQFLPPGKSSVIASDDRDLPVRCEVVADESEAARWNDQVQFMLSRAKLDEGDHPFIDFAHTRQAAAAWVLGLFWAGTHPKEGGIRARVSWTALGAFAILGAVYRRFSPSWYLDVRSQLFIGVGACLGGLTNLAAFTSIQGVGGIPADRVAGHEEAKRFLRIAASLPGTWTEQEQAAAELRPDLFHCWNFLQPGRPQRP